MSAVYDIDIHPTLDVILTCGRDATARVWDIRTKVCNLFKLTYVAYGIFGTICRDTF